MAQKIFLVTGTSQGIGKASVELLAKKNHIVFAGVRNLTSSEMLKKISANVYPVLLEVTDSQSIENARLEIERVTNGKGLDGLVNNAAIAVSAPIELLPLVELRRLLDVNVIGLIGVTQTFLPMLRKNRGRIVNVGSLSGLLTTPFLGSYCASKYAVEAVNDALRIELKNSNIKVSLIEPGSINTPMWRESINYSIGLEKKMPEEFSIYKKAIENFYTVATKTGDEGIPTSKVAEKIAHALLSHKPKTRYLVGKEALSYAIIKKILPDRAFDYLIYKELKMN